MPPESPLTLSEEPDVLLTEGSGPRLGSTHEHSALERETQKGETTSNALLAQKQRQLQLITDSVPVLVSYVDKTGRYQFVNKNYETWFGKAHSGLVGQHLSEVLGAEAYAKIEPFMLQALAGTQVTFESRVPYSSGGTRWIKATYVPHRREDGGVHGFVALVTDISEHKSLQTAREATALRTERLMKVTAAIADAVTTEQVYEALVDQMAAAIGASSASLWLRDPNAETASLVRSVGYQTAPTSQWVNLPLQGAFTLPALHAIFRNEPVWIGSQAELLAAYPHLGAVVTAGRQYRAASLPISAQGRPLGSLALTFDDEQEVDADEKHFLLLVARYSGQALERLRLLENERTARTKAETAAARMSVLSRASRAFSEVGPDLGTLLETVVREVTKEYADCCGISLVPETGDTLQLAALHHRDPQAQATILSTLRAVPARLGEGVTGMVAITGKPVLVPTLDQQLLVKTHPSHRDWVERHRPKSLIVAPLRVRGRVLGTLTAIRHEGLEPFVDDDLLLLHELAERAALAIEGAQLHEANQQARARAEMLHHLAKEVIRADNAAQVFQAALDAIEAALGAKRSSILAFDDAGVMRFKAWRGLSQAYRNGVEGHSPWKRDDKSAEPIWVSDVQAAPQMEHFSDLFRKENIASLGFIPLMAGETLVGKFMVYFDEPRDMTTAEVDLAKSIANHTATAISRFAAIEQLQQTVRFNEMFTAILGHDLRNPLGAIMTAAQLASKRDEVGILAKPLGRILSSGHRMARMIDQLLDFTRVRVGSGIPLAPEVCDLASVLRQVIDELDGANPNKAIQLEITTARTLGYWDFDRLLQVFSNLIANALQHGTDGQGVRVRIESGPQASLLVRIHNAGAIPEALIPRLFEPMAGGDRRRDKSHGLGLGLYISQEIIRAHSGLITVRSSEAEGTSFTVMLPAEVEARVLP